MHVKWKLKPTMHECTEMYENQGQTYGKWDPVICTLAALWCSRLCQTLHSAKLYCLVTEVWRGVRHPTPVERDAVELSTESFRKSKRQMLTKETTKRQTVTVASTEHPIGCKQQPIGCSVEAVATVIGCFPTQALAFSPVSIQTQRTQRKRLRLDGYRA